uniref:endothelial zinc finger protein induced by tumor necrosis factor alpha-like isoform X2 n=1 Tax=Oncorhynchus gorbuscha TaxID=8017 RepID=UPI001EAEA851|nr:endothelial zinc finger protein induced by tumor necrosis factor alpha-like isoform X2 [Oncorhynchus gorbuscha]
MDPTTFSGPHLPLSSLRLLVPPLRLMSASMWQVAQQRNVMQYGKLEEFVTLVTEMVPELLTLKQRVQLILGLRARLVLELCRGVESNPAGYKTIQPHLDRIHSCTTHKGSEDKEVEASKDNFVELVQTLLEDSMKREHFFQEVFPVQYSTRYDTALQILVWQFFDRLEEMLPVPSFTQTASILNLTPTDLEECQQSFSDPEHLKTLLQHHRNLGHLKKGQAKAKPPQSQGFSCSQCQFSNRRWLTLQEHIKENHPKEDRGILDSGEAGAENNVLPVSETESSSAKKTRKNRYICSQCGKGFRNLCDLRRHESVHSEARPFHCDQCEKRYKTKGCLKQHQKVHQANRIEERTYVCSHCGRGIKKTEILKSHERTHTGERPYVCSICGKGFIQSNGLTQHLRMHRGEKPFLCSVCGITLSTSGQLRVHMRTHTGEQPYSCQLCGRRFKQPESLTVHLLSQTGERPYPCTLCDKRFASSSCVKKHMRTHTGEKPYRCIRCGKRFTESGNLKIHQRVHREKV